MKKIIIFGCGGHAKIVFDCIKLMKNYRSIGFMDNQDYNSELSRKIKYLGSIEDFNNVIKGHDLKELLGVVAIGSNFIRRKVVQVIAKINNRFKWMNIIHPSAIVSNSAKIGSGNMILAGSIVCSDTIINNHVSINTGTCIDYDNIFSNFYSSSKIINENSKKNSFVISNKKIREHFDFEISTTKKIINRCCKKILAQKYKFA